MLEIPDVFKGLLILICVFIPVEKIWVMHKQKFWREGYLTDLIYYFSGFFINNFVKLKSEQTNRKE